MTDEQIAVLLRERGYAEHVCRAGRVELLRRWRGFVEQVERGYPLGLEDYRNDLDLRAAIADAGFEAEARETDERFERMLIARQTRVWESLPGGAFWDYGYPRNASGELLEGLRAEGLA